MPLISQCNRCGKKGTDYCPFYGKDASAEPGRCSAFYESSDSVKPFVKISGESSGLLVFCMVCIGLGGLITFASSLVSCIAGNYHPNWALALSSVLLGVLLLALAVYAIISMYKKRANAVFLCVSYIAIVVIVNVLSLLSGDGDNTVFNSPARLVVSLIAGTLWIVYLLVSPTVKERIPIANRKVRVIDAILVINSLAIPLIFAIGGVAIDTKIQSKADLKERAELQNYGCPSIIQDELRLDSVQYLTYENEYVYYYSYASDDTMAYFYHALLLSCDASDIKDIILPSLEDDPLKQLLIDADANLKYVYKTNTGSVLLTATITPEELQEPVDDEVLRRALIANIKQEILVVNEFCPNQIDETTTLSRCHFDKEKLEISYDYTFSYLKDQLNLEHLRESIAEDKAQIIAEMDQRYKDIEATLVYRYLDIKGVEIATFTITPKDY